jgi:ribosomal protein L19
MKIFADKRRARRLMQEPRRSSLARRLAHMYAFRPSFPAFDVGDAVELEVAHDLESTTPHVVRGTVIGKKRGSNDLDASFELINHVLDDKFRVSYKLFSPLLRSLRVMRRRHATGGAKRPRRAKLYYLWERAAAEFRVTRETKEQWENELEARIRREQQARGRSASRRAVQTEKEKLLRTGKGLFKLDSTFDDQDDGARA